jgi:hypothetical protein
MKELKSAQIWFRQPHSKSIPVKSSKGRWHKQATTNERNLGIHLLFRNTEWQWFYSSYERKLLDRIYCAWTDQSIIG